MAEREKIYHITPDGISYLINDGINTFYMGSAGFGYRAEPASQRVPGQDGAEALGLYVPPREISIAIKIFDDTSPLWKARDAALRRNLAASTIQARSDDTLCTLRRITEDGRTRDIDAWLVSFPNNSEDVVGWTAGGRVLRYWAKDPLFYDPTELTETLAMSGGGISFPIEFPLEIAGTGIDDYVYPDVPGDAEVWTTIRIQGTGGEDPVIENETVDAKIDLSAGTGVTLDADDYIDIDMNAATITFHDETAGTDDSILEKLSADSEFWYLVPGSNSIHVTMTSATSASFILTYNPRYVAV
jgi:hypothetical protein